MMRRIAALTSVSLVAFACVGCEAFGNLGKKQDPATAQAPPKDTAATQPPVAAAPAPAPQPLPPPSENAAAEASPQPSQPITGSEEPKPKESYAPAQRSSSRVHIVKKGESLGSLAKRFYGDSGKWRRIYEANRQRISNPNDIRAGMKLIIP